MKNKIVIILIAVLLVTSLAACQPAAPAANTYPGQIRSLVASGQGQVYLTPDIAFINIGVHSQAKSVADALKQNSDLANSIAAALKNQGVDAKDIQTSNFNVYPQQVTGPNGETTNEVMYNVDNTVNVTIRDLTKLGQILDATTAAGANNINSIQFDAKDKNQAFIQARQMAIDNAKQQAAEIAKAAGVTLGNVFNVSVSTPPNPVPMYEGKGGMAASNVPVSAGQLVITADASITYELK